MTQDAVTRSQRGREPNLPAARRRVGEEVDARMHEPPSVPAHMVIDLPGAPALILELPSGDDVGLAARERSYARVHYTQL